MFIVRRGSAIVRIGGMASPDTTSPSVITIRRPTYEGGVKLLEGGRREVSGSCEAPKSYLHN